MEQQQNTFTASPSGLVQTILTDLKQLFKSPENWLQNLATRSGTNESLVLLSISFLLSLLGSLWTFFYYLNAFNAPLQGFSPQLYKIIRGSLSEGVSLVVLVFVLQLFFNHKQNKEQFFGVKSGLLLSAYGCLGYSIIGVLNALFEFFPNGQLSVLFWTLETTVTLFVSTGLCVKFFGNVQIKQLFVLNFLLMAFTKLW